MLDEFSNWPIYAGLGIRKFRERKKLDGGGEAKDEEEEEEEKKRHERKERRCSRV